MMMMNILYMSIFPFTPCTSHRRRKEVEGVLLRNVIVEGEEADDSDYAVRQEFVINRLGIPKMWIHKAKATKARSLGM